MTITIRWILKPRSVWWQKGQCVDFLMIILVMIWRVGQCATPHVAGLKRSLLHDQVLPRDETHTMPIEPFKKSEET